MNLSRLLRDDGTDAGLKSNSFRLPKKSKINSRTTMQSPRNQDFSPIKSKVLRTEVTSDEDDIIPVIVQKAKNLSKLKILKSSNKDLEHVNNGNLSWKPNLKSTQAVNNIFPDS
jgi:hypothetical protein